MAWTVVVSNVKKDSGKAYIDISAVDPSFGTFSNQYVVNFQTANGLPAEYVAWLKRQVTGWLSTIQSVYGFADVVPVGTFSPTIAPPSTDPSRDAFLADIILRRRFKNAILAGIKTGTDSDVVTVNQRLQATYAIHPEYVDLFDTLGG